jgi:hypothetical protein
MAADRPGRHAHTKLIPGDDTCRRCRQLLGLRPVTPREAFELVERYTGRPLRNTGISTTGIEPIRALPNDWADRRAP